MTTVEKKLKYEVQKRLIEKYERLKALVENEGMLSSIPSERLLDLSEKVGGAYYVALESDPSAAELKRAQQIFAELFQELIKI